MILPNIWKNKIHVPNHQSVYIYTYWHLQGPRNVEIQNKQLVGIADPTQFG